MRRVPRIQVTIPQTLQALLETQSSSHGLLSQGMISSVQSWRSSPAAQGPRLGDTWHIASLVMTHQTIHSDFFNSITRPFGSQMGKGISTCAGQKSSCVLQEHCPQTLACSPTASQPRAAMLPGHWDTYSTCSHVEHCVYQLSLFAQSPLPHPHPQDCPQSSNQRVNAWHSRGLVCPRVSHQPCKVLDTIPYWLDAPQGGPAGQVPLASCI